MQTFSYDLVMKAMLMQLSKLKIKHCKSYLMFTKESAQKKQFNFTHSIPPPTSRHLTQSPKKVLTCSLVVVDCDMSPMQNAKI